MEDLGPDAVQATFSGRADVAGRVDSDAALVVLATNCLNAAPALWKPQFRQFRYAPNESEASSTVPVLQRGHERK